MTEIEIIRIVFGIGFGLGGGVLLLLAFTVGYRYLVMEQRCTCRTNGTVTGYSAACYGGENSAVHLPVVRYTVEGREYRVTGPRYRGYVTRSVSTPFAENACRCYEKNGVLLGIDLVSGEFFVESRNPEKAAALYDDLFVFRGLDESDLKNDVLVGQYLELKK